MPVFRMLFSASSFMIAITSSVGLSTRERERERTSEVGGWERERTNNLLAKRRVGEKPTSLTHD
jgi:hypothetical protein